ncbi:MAG: hypothetical protein OEQ74_00030 [Gammaproteobacteria bacterium]|nr:hypothetical protein [Gammaproteobacteria bacterium]
MRIRLGDVTTTTARLTAVVISGESIQAEIEPVAAISIAAPDQRVASPYLATQLISFSGLQPFTRYNYSITQGSQTLTGSFVTLPDDQVTPFSMIIATCDGPARYNPMDTFQTMRRLVQEADPPVLYMVTVDDVHYVDSYEVNDPETGFVTGGRPEDTNNGEDYAICWAANYGLFNSDGKWQMVDRQWIYRNLPHGCSGGDHMVTGNHCRGPVGHHTYHGCDRAPGGLQETAFAEWQAFYGQQNPDPLRPDELYWAKDIGPVRMACTDIQKHCIAFDPDVNGTGQSSDTPMLGQTQIDDVMDHLDTDAQAFKILLLETGFSKVGQPWLEYHSTEASDWKTDLDSRPNLNGTQGNFIGIYGDHHSMHSVSFDTFWGFCAGTLGDSFSVGHNLHNATWGWGGALQYKWTSFRRNGDVLVGGFLHVIVHADKSPRTVEIRFIHGGSGEVMFSRTIEYGAVANQFSQ